MKLEIDNDEILAPVMDELAQIKREIQAERTVLSYLLMLNKQKMVWKISDMATALGCSYEQLRGKDRWKLPRFGQSAFPTGPTRWPLEECLRWIDKSEQEKKGAYNEYIRAEMRKESAKRKKKAAI